MELHDIDLNLLVVFRQLLLERRVSRVAETLGVSQPAVSNSLAKLRRLFGDELFLRTPGGMQPTTYAQQLAGPVNEALALLHGGINLRASFEPATSDRAFTLGMTDIGEIYFLPTLAQHLRQHAPAVTLSTVRDTAVDQREELASGQMDLAIGLLPQLRAGFYQRRLFTQRYVCLMRRGHRLGRKRLSQSDYAAAEHLVVVAAGTGHGQVDALLARNGIERRVHLSVPHYLSVGHILADSDLIATVPERLADRLLEPFGLEKAAHPVKLPDVAINLFWHARYHRDPANRWLRELMIELFADRRAPATARRGTG
ncbi:MAG: LysR family transcriptional regulator [Burkholderiales bacterium]|nr:LysR family transcriptional regulator [Burkholderiales bacterium]